MSRSQVGVTRFRMEGSKNVTAAYDQMDIDEDQKHMGGLVEVHRRHVQVRRISRVEKITEANMRETTSKTCG